MEFMVHLSVLLSAKSGAVRDRTGGARVLNRRQRALRANDPPFAAMRADTSPLNLERDTGFRATLRLQHSTDGIWPTLSGVQPVFDTFLLQEVALDGLRMVRQR